MSLVNAKCTNCGGILEVDNTKDAMMCKFCGSAFIVEKAIQNFNITNVTNNNIETQIVHIHAPEKSDFEIEKGVLKSYSGSDKIIIVPENVCEIGEGAFEDCKYIEEIKLPSNIKIIGKKAFYNCACLKIINLPETVEIIGESCFYNCPELDFEKLPSSLQVINKYAFYGCGIKNIEIHNNILYIQDYAFCGCKKLEKCVIGNKIFSVANYAFSGCINLKEVVFGEKVSMIYSHAFYKCGLEKIELPKTITYIDEFAFAYNKIRNIVLDFNKCSICKSAFESYFTESLTIKGMGKIEKPPFYFNKNSKIQMIIDSFAFKNAKVKEVNLVNTKLNHCIVCDGELFLGKCKNCKTKYKKSK